MYPVLLTIGPVSVSSFGFFVALGFLVAVFNMWKLAKIYDLDEERILDLALWTFFGGFIFSRIFFLIFSWPLYSDLAKAILIYLYPGFSFWGGVIGGIVTCWYFSRRFKLKVWQVLDLASVAFLIGVAVADIGCFLGGCVYGKVSNLPIATPIVGLIGKRLPISLIEALIYCLLYLHLKRMVVKYHFPGKVFSLMLIHLGVIKFILDSYRGDVNIIYLWLSLGQVFAAISVSIGVCIYYIQAKRSVVEDIRYLVSLVSSNKRRAELITQVKKNWYNYRVYWQLHLASLPKYLKRRLNVRATPKDLR